MLRILSLGAGVQSTALLLMGIAGEFGPPPDMAIFADTGWEPADTYAHLDWLEREVAPFPILRVRRPQGAGIRTDTIRATTHGERFAGPPFFVRISATREGPLRRQCTKEYKLEPLQRAISALCAERGIKKRAGVVEQWLGISLDEAMRMKPSRVKYITNRFPLIEGRLTRTHCLRWMEARGYPRPPKSACIGCPYHSDAMWRDMKDNKPEEWADAVEFDAAIRKGKIGNVEGDAYLHRSLMPLADVDLSTPEDHGQLNFLDECEGMCGV